MVVEYLRGDVDLGWKNADENFWTACHVSARHGSSKCLKCLIKAGAHLGAIDGEGRTPLHVSYKYGAMKCVRLLKNQKSFKTN